MVEGTPGPRKKSRSRRRWLARILIVGLLAGLALWQVLTPRIVDPQPAGLPEVPADESPEIAGSPAEKAPPQGTQTETPAVAGKRPEPDPDAPRVTPAEAVAAWPELFAKVPAPRPFVEAAFRDELRRGVTAAELDRWLKPVADEDSRIVAEEQAGTPIVSVRGFLQLRPPWPVDGVLRIEPFATKNLRLLMWNGTRGIALSYAPGAPDAWSASAIERPAGDRRPQSAELLTTDNGAAQRTPNQSVDIHHQGDHLIVSRGGLRMLTVPINSLPEVVFVEGDTSLRAFGMDRRTPLPDPDMADLSSGSETDAAGDASHRIERLALFSADRGNMVAFSRLSQALLAIPPGAGARVDAVPFSLAAAELVPLADAGRAADVATAWQKLSFWNTPSDPAETWPGERKDFRRLFDWANDATRSAGLPAKSEPANGDSERRHPWLVKGGRDTPSAASEFNAALGDSALDAACRVIVSTAPPWDSGLVADARDVKLSVSWPQLIRNALRDEPRLRGLMEQTQSRLGELRLNQAVAEGDVAAVRSASVQFLGTPAAARAHLELGDQALALGRFANALAYFQAGGRDASDDLRDSLTQRMRLAGSLLGMELGPPAVASVTLNDRKMTAGQFDALLVAQRRRALVSLLQPNDVLAHRAASLPAAGRYGLHPVASWKATIVPDPKGQASPPTTAHLAVDPAGGLIATGPFGICSLAPTDNRVRWSLPANPDQSGEFQASRPASAGDRIFVRRPSAGGDELVCVDPESGALKWQHPRAVLPVVSDPLWSQRQLFVVTLENATQGSRLSLCELDPDTGKSLFQVEIGEVRSGDATPRFCLLAAQDDRLIIATAGGVLCCDRIGEVRWLQRSTLLPADIHSDLHAPAIQPALLIPAEGVVAVLQPGAMGIQAFDLESGRRIWQRATPDLDQILGTADGLIFALTPRGLLAWQGATGECAWSRPMARLQSISSISTDGHVAVGEIEVNDSGQRQLVIHSLAAANGNEQATATIELSKAGLEIFNPLAASSGRFFLFGHDRDQATAHLLEMKGIAEGSR